MRFRPRVIDGLVLGAVVIAFAAMRSRHSAPAVEMSDFARQVNLAPLYRTAVQADGRLRSFESHAKTFMGYVSGSRSIRGQSDGFTYLDLMLRPESYVDEEIINVKNKDVRRQVLEAARGIAPVDSAKAERLMERGLFPKSMLIHPQMIALLQRLGQDLIRTAKSVDAIRGAMNVSEPKVLSSNLRMIAPPGGETDRPWLSLDEITGTSAVPRDKVHAGKNTASPPSIPGLSAETQRKLVEAWQGFGDAWRAQDAKSVNEQIVTLGALLPGIAPAIYPTAGRLGTESWYFRYQSMTWVWLIYFAAVVPLLMSTIYQWDRARTAGIVLFVIAFLAHTAAVGIRWYISGRWPNANMFEALTTSAWFGGVGALILETIARRTSLRNLFALGAAVMSMVALMAAYFLPAQLDSTINNKMAALNDVWLYIHTNMIIWSYSVIGLACVPALLQLRHRWCQLWDQHEVPKVRLLMLPIAFAVLNYTGYLLLMRMIDSTAFALPGRLLLAVVAAFACSLILVVMEAASARARSRRGGFTERSAEGGAASIILAPSPTGSFMRGERPTASQVFDGATMVLVELAFIMLWTGTVMGAIWADHSWGRPWGWDPKEVFALNTFLIFLILIHVRLKVRDKAFWTALLAVAGFEVMMFNWIVVNFVISGLHSYA